MYDVHKNVGVHFTWQNTVHIRRFIIGIGVHDNGG